MISATSLQAQNKTVTVRNAEGMWEVSADITMTEAEEKALMEAKKEALRKAGIMENVWSVFGEVSSSEGNKFSHAYSSVSVLAINGLVNILDKKVEDRWDSRSGKLFKIVTINAAVTKNEAVEDQSYKLEVKGVDPVYKEGDIFRCSFKIYGTDSYLKIFWFDNESAAMIYPNDYEGNVVFEAGKEYHIPVTDAIDLVMEKTDNQADTEIINFIAVATKKDYPYLGKMDFQSILTWIFNLPADQRALFHSPTIIK